MADKRSKLDKQISRLQKNARNKMYRLRQKGIVNAQIGASFAPLIPMKQVQQMTKLEKRKYAKELEQFNSRQTAFQVQKGVETVMQKNRVGVPAAQLWEYRIAEAAANIAAQNMRESLNKRFDKALENMNLSDITALEEFSGGTTAETVLAEQSAVYGNTGRYRDVNQIVRNMPFTSAENLEKAIKAQQQRKKHIESPDNKRYESWRKAIIKGMEANNADAELINQVKNLKAVQMQWLHYYTDFDELVNQYQYDTDSGLSMISETMVAGSESALRPLLQVANRVRPDKRITGYTTKVVNAKKMRRR